jgi:predicted metal-dependent hydrolase
LYDIQSFFWALNFLTQSTLGWERVIYAIMTEPIAPLAPSVEVAFPVRRLRIDLSAGFGRLWAGGDPYRTHHLNALSMSFPVVEQFFIDWVKKGVSLLPAPDQEAWASRIDGLVGQEATHRFLHAQFNAQL